MEFLFVACRCYIYQQRYLQAISLALVRLHWRFKKHQRSCAVHSWQKSRRRRNKNRFLLEIVDLLVFTHFLTTPPSPLAQSISYRRSFLILWLKQTRETEQQELSRSFQLPHPVWPSGVGAPRRSHSADYLRRL